MVDTTQVHGRPAGTLDFARRVARVLNAGAARARREGFVAPAPVRPADPEMDPCTGPDCPQCRKVRDLESERHARAHGGWSAARVRCRTCGKQWAATWPGGEEVLPLECPGCGAFSGMPVPSEPQ